MTTSENMIQEAYNTKPRLLNTNNLPQYLLAFLFPFLTVISALAINECYPFGSRTMLTVDLYHQYAPFLVAFRNKVLGGESLLYSWCDGCGNEYFGAYANYSASPLNIFSLLFTAKTMPVFIGLVTSVRAGLASLFMTKFLKENDEGRLDNITVAFASAYALCGWFVTDFWNIMWADAVVLLPLIILGLRRLMLNGKWGLYIISLAISLISNYYSGYFICLFLVIFAPLYYLMLYKPAEDRTDPLRISFKSFLTCAGRFAAGSLLAGAMSAFITVPTYLILQHCSATGDDLEANFQLQNSLFDFLGRFLVSANPNIRDGMANVNCGLIAVILLPLLFLLPKKSGITLRHKISFGIILLIMYLSFSNRMLNFIWHGMHFPNQIPYRQSFLMSFVIVFAAHLVIRRIRMLSVGKIMGSVAGAAIFLVLFEKFGDGNEGYIQIGLTLLFLFVQGAALYVVTKKTSKSTLFRETLITVTMLIEIFAASVVTISLVADNEGFVSYDFFGKNKDQIETYVNDVEGSEGHRTFERSELYPNNICDIQSIYNVKGISIFSSTARESFVKYMRNYGFHNNGINGFRNAGLTRVTASILGIRNLIEIKETQTVPALFDLDYVEGEVRSFGNPDALSVGFVTSRNIVDYYPDSDTSDVFEKTNSWIAAMGSDQPVYTPINMTPVEETGFTTNDPEGSVIQYISNGGDDEEVSFTVTLSDVPAGNDVYVYVNSNKGGTVAITQGEIFRNFEIRSYQIITCGVADGNDITLTVNYSDNPGTIRAFAYCLNPEGYQAMLDTLGREQLNVTSYDTTSLEGEVTTEGGFLFLTIPYSEGWTCTVDGTPTELVPIGDALMGVDLTAGTHMVKLVYAPAGITIGIVISFAALIISIGVIILTNGRRKKITDITPVISYEETEDNMPQVIEEVPYTGDGDAQ
ncbi:MAG: YfhO family protein [Clostridiales bacterium]|nr:YfhO family protein [Clostridiales bacterium]